MEEKKENKKLEDGKTSLSDVFWIITFPVITMGSLIFVTLDTYGYEKDICLMIVIIVSMFWTIFSSMFIVLKNIYRLQLKKGD